MSTNEFDVIVAGAGVGGLCAGALLAKKEGKRVLVLERTPRIGGRIHHYKGDEIETVEDYLGPLESFTGSLAYSEPSIEKIIEDGMLAGYNFELGMHDIVNGAQSRLVHVLDALEVPVEIIPLKACGFWSDGKLHEMTRGSFPWMAREEYAEMRAILGGMLKLPLDTVLEHYRESLHDYLVERTSDPKVLEFFDILGAFTVGMNSAKELSAGEFMLITRMPMAAGLHFADGTLGQMGGESFMQVAHNLASVITAEGGEVRTGWRVRQILVEDGVVQGVEVRTPTGEIERIECPLVVSNIPLPLLVDQIIPADALPQDFVKRTGKLTSSGAVTPIFGLSKSVIDIPGMLMTKVPVDHPDLPDGVVLGYEAHSLFVEGKAPTDKEIIECWVGLETHHLRQLRESGGLDALCQAIMTFFKENHPGFEEALEWALFPAFEYVVNVAPTPDQAWDQMLDPKCPGIDGLYFVGDSVKNYGGFMDGVAFTSLLTVSEITGNDYLGEILPPYQRERRDLSDVPAQA